MTSKGSMTYPNRGMNFYCEASKEFQVDRDWFRVEIYRESPGEDLKASGYKRIGVYWAKYFNQRLAMEKRAMLDHALGHKEAA